MDEFKHQQRINSILRDFLQHIFTHNFMILGIKSLFYTVQTFITIIKFVYKYI